MTLTSKKRWDAMSPHERRRRFNQLSSREKNKVFDWQQNDEINEPIAEHRYAIKCDLAEEKRLRIKKRKEERREIQNVLIEVIARRTHSPKEMARISGLTKTYILSLSVKNFTKEEHGEFLAMDEGIPPKGPRTPQRIDLRTPEERWLDDYDAWVERRLEACRKIWANTKM